MSVALKKSTIEDAIHQEIQSHIAWYGDISGLKAEKMLREIQTPYVYILRAGEIDLGNQKDYYVSYVLEDLTIKHQPFVVMDTPDGWYYENSGGGGPYEEASIFDVLHLIMHCQQDEITPLTKLQGS